MAAPTVTQRVIPTGYKVPDGFKTTISGTAMPGVQFYEQTVQPPGIDGGDAINTTTMLNVAWRTFSPRQLKTLMPIKLTAAYDPQCIPSLVNIINLPQSLTVHFPEGASIAFYGFIQKFEPKENKEGEMPLCDLTVTPTNQDYVNQVEAGPLYTPSSGTA